MAIESLYRQAIQFAKDKREAGQALIALGHCHLTGGMTSEDSERRIVIGGAEALTAEMFDESVAYVALGHLHLPQEIGGQSNSALCRQSAAHVVLGNRLPRGKFASSQALIVASLVRS